MPGFANGPVVGISPFPPFSCPCMCVFGSELFPVDVLAPGFSFMEAQMGKKLYVGNLTYGVTNELLEQMFAPHGTVQSAQIIMDRDTGRSKGFGFVEMSSDQEAQTAISAMN